MIIIEGVMAITAIRKTCLKFKETCEVLKNGKSIIIFPEGTFTYATGLQPFKMGAFKLATEQNVAVCPIALKGTRSVLRSRQWLPKIGKIEVTILPVIYPQQNTWAEAIRLRDFARMEIAKHCGEYPIDLVTSLKTSIPTPPPHNY